MFGKNSRLNPLESRKQLLLAESELNRAQIARDMAVLVSGARSLTHRAKALGLVASLVAAVMAARAAFHRGGSAKTEAKPSRLQSILKGVGLISTLWTAFRPKHRDGDGNRSADPLVG
jgi:hypothetical protein